MDHLPLTIRAIVDNANVTEISVGMSSDAVYRIDTNERYFLKIGETLKAEYERLQWLADKLPTPRVIHYEVNQGKHYLLTSEVPGEMLFEVDLPIERKLELMAESARMWHSLSIEDCPFDMTMNPQIETARHNLDHHRINASRFASQFYGKSESELFTDLLNAIPEQDEDLVVTHGDLCLPNILVDGESGQITGFVDLGDVGVSDRHLDLVLASRSIEYNLGGKYIDRFYEHYGIPIDPEKYHFYSILNEFV